MGEHKPEAIAGAGHLAVTEPYESDFTLHGLVAELAECGFRVDCRLASNFVSCAPQAPHPVDPVLMPTPNRAAASRRDIPFFSTVATTYSRRSSSQ
jgi:hypothetical protein